MREVTLEMLLPAAGLRTSAFGSQTPLLGSVFDTILDPVFVGNLKIYGQRHLVAIKNL